MLSSRKKKAYGTVVALAVVAFGVDRLLAPGPEPAAAAGSRPSQRPAVSKSAPAASTSKTGEKAAADRDNPVINALRALPEVPDVRDLFAQPGPARGPAGRSFVGENGDPDTDPAEVFRSTHRLEATYRDGSEMVAVVDRALIRPGQCIDGFCLSAVHPFRAVFRHQDVEVTLEMNVDGQGPKKRPAAKGPENPPGQ